MVFCFVQNYFFGQHKRYNFILGYASVHTYIKGFKIKLSLICTWPIAFTNHHFGIRPSSKSASKLLLSKVGRTLMGRLSYIRHKNKQESSFSANGFVNAGSLSLMFNLKTSSKRQWKLYGWRSWFLIFCRSSRKLYYILYCSIATIWIHFKRNYNLSDQVLINVITFVLFSLNLNRS
jgi:hypothetical protein